MIYTQRSRYIHIQINKYLSELYMIFNFRNRDEKTDIKRDTEGRKHKAIQRDKDKGEKNTEKVLGREWP